MIFNLSLVKICKAAVDNMDPVRMGKHVQRPTFGNGDEPELVKFLSRRRPDGWYLPLIWLLPFEPTAMEYGQALEANVTFNLCARETRNHKDNVDREELSFDQVLRPLWIEFYKAMELTHQVTWAEESYSPGKLTKVKAGSDMWDVLPVSITIQYSNENHCNKN
jgi:hypothetical protein